MDVGCLHGRLRAEEQWSGGGRAGRRECVRRKLWRPCRAVVEKGALVQLFPCNAHRSGLRNPRKSGLCVQTAGGQSFRMVPNP